MSRRERKQVEENERLASMTAAIVRSYVSFNRIAPSDILFLLQTVHEAFVFVQDGPPLPMRPKPAVPINKSHGDDFIICLEDGRRMQLLTRYLKTRYKMTPRQYRAKWGLPANYPMITPEYARRRAGLAARMRIGRGKRR